MLPRQSHARTFIQLWAACGIRGRAMRIKPYRPNFFKTPAWSMAVGEGAELYPSGAQEWNGQSETRMPNPNNKSGKMKFCALFESFAPWINAGMSNVFKPDWR